MIVFGDCINQFERMVESRGKLYSSLVGHKKPRVNSTMAHASEDTQARSLKDVADSRNNQTQDINVTKPSKFRDNKNADLSFDKKAKRRYKQGSTAQSPVVKHTDSLFSLAVTDLEKTSKESPRGILSKEEEVKSQQAGLPAIKQASHALLVPASLALNDSPRQPKNATSQ